jgi:aminoglycoside phosphotransferase family enzyme
MVANLKLESSKEPIETQASSLESGSFQIPPEKQGGVDAYVYNYNANPIFESETTLLLVISNTSNDPKYVIKILKEYKDLRYQMATPDERQQCQLEALEQNRRFTPDVYLGLARLHCWDRENKNVNLGEIIAKPDQNSLDKGADYVLVMKYLQETRRLDCLLHAKPISNLMEHMELLGEVIAKIHTSKTYGNKNIANDASWGSCEQLEQKLNHNLPFLQYVLTATENEQVSLNSNLKEVFERLGKLMQRAFCLQDFRDCFTERLRQQRIKHCHGDLKATNIWILQSEQYNAQASLEQVKILDAIDFNPTYCNIDILADMAMLAVDIEAGVSYKAARHFIHHYLKETGQGDKPAKTVLPYYLVEKAMIGVIVCFVYDKLPKEVGLQYLQVAKRHMRELQHLERAMWFKSIVKGISKKHILRRIIAAQEGIKRHNDASGHSNSSKGIAAWVAIPIIFILAHFAFHRSSTNHSE